MSEADLAVYADTYLSDRQESGLYGKIMGRQGVIVQPYNHEFTFYGEKKITVIDGNITLARRTVPPAQEGEKLQNSVLTTQEKGS